MRIGINALQVRAAKSGVGQYIDGLIDGLLACLAPDDRLIVYANFENAMNYRREDSRVQLRVFGPHARRVVRLAHEWIFLPGQIKRDRLDVYHGPSNFLPRSCPCPAVVTIHDASRWVNPERYTRANLTYWRFMIGHTVRLKTPVITDSHAAKADLVKHLGIAPERIHVVHIAAHPRFRILQRATEDSLQLLQSLGVQKPYVLHVGTLEPGKNIVRLVEAFAQFRSAGHETYRLIMAGDRGWKVEEIFGAVERHGLHQVVRYVGHVKDVELPVLYNEAEMFVFPSMNEGFGLPPLEAMQCGLPVIASNRSSLPEVLGDAAMLVEPTDAAVLANAMNEVADDAALRERLISSGIKQAATYSWQQTARNTLEVYRSAIL